jgi:hypothetical protein
MRDNLLPYADAMKRSRGKEGRSGRFAYRQRKLFQRLGPEQAAEMAMRPKIVPILTRPGKGDGGACDEELVRLSRR